jgi:hypothetical protein
VFALWGAAGEVIEPDEGVRGVPRVAAGDVAGSRESQSQRGDGATAGDTRRARRAQQTQGGSMERGETTEPDGGVMLVAMAVCTLIAFVTGVVVGYGAALVLR